MNDDDGLHQINFGCLPPLPPGYWVAYCESIEHYVGFGPGNWESAMTVNRFDARRWCFERAARLAND